MMSPHEDLKKNKMPLYFLISATNSLYVAFFLFACVIILFFLLFC